MKENVRKHLMMNNLLSKKQYGFINGRSTTTQLLYYLDNCISTIGNSIAEGGVIDTIYLDFAKAFDTVPRRRLLGKLNAFGVQGKLFNWIKEFLCGRTQVVKVNGTQSEDAAVFKWHPARNSIRAVALCLIYKRYSG